MALIERESALAALRGRLSDAAEGQGQLVWIAGEAGAGKSSLARAFTAACDAATNIRWGACDPLTTARPLGALRDIAGRDGPLAEAIRTGPLHEVFVQVGRELADSPAPVVLVVEDAHWADEATCDLLRYLGRRLPGLRALVLVTYRDDEVGPEHPLRLVLGDLASAPGTSRVPVPALSLAAVTTLAMTHGLDGAALHEMTNGNAFFVSEIVAAAPASLPETVSDAVLARAARLPARARAALDAASVIPVGFEPWLVEHVGAVGGAEVDTCVSAGLLLPDGDRLRFRHEIARLAVEAALTPNRRRELHREVLRALAGVPGVDPARLAHHAGACGDTDAVIEYGAAAAAAAARLGAHREAATHYTAVLLRSHGLPPDRRADLLERRSYECYLTGQPQDAIASRQVALELWRQEGDLSRAGDALRWLSRLCWFLGRNEEAAQLGREAVEVLEQLPSGAELAMAYSNLAQIAMLRSATEDTEHWGGKARRLAEALGRTDVLAHALNNIGSVRYRAGDPSGRALLEQSLDLALAHGLEEHAARAYANLVSVAVRQRSTADATALLQAGLAYCRERDLDAWALYMTSWQAHLALHCDQWDDALEAAGAVLRRSPASPVAAVTAKAVLARLHARRGDADALGLAEEALTFAQGTAEPQRLVPAVTAYAEVAWLLDAPLPESALAALHEVAATGNEWERGELALWAARHGVRIAVTGAPGVPYFSCLRGAHADAVVAWTGMGCSYEAALAALDSDSPELTRRAVEWLTRLGAGGALRKAAVRLHGLGLRGPRTSTAANPAGLTDREVEVLRLLAGGLSNAAIAGRLVVSKRTVDHHVSTILRKLGVATRSDAARHARALLEDSAAT